MQRLFWLIVVICVISTTNQSSAQNQNSSVCRQKYDWLPSQNILILGEDHTLTVYNYYEESIIFEQQFSNSISDAKLAKNGQYLTVVEENFIVSRWHIDTKTKTTELDFSEYSEYIEDSGFESHAISASGQYLYINFYGKNSYVAIWDLATGEQLRDYGYIFRDPTFASNENYLIETWYIVSSWGTQNGVIFVWNWDEDFENFTEFGSGSYGTFYNPKFEPHMNRLAVSFTNTVIFFRIEHFKNLLLGHREFELSVPPTQNIYQITWHPSGELLATAIREDNNHYVKTWNSQNGALVTVYPEQLTYIRELYFDENMLLGLGCIENRWMIWKIENLEVKHTIEIEGTNG